MIRAEHRLQVVCATDLPQSPDMAEPVMVEHDGRISTFGNPEMIVYVSGGSWRRRRVSILAWSAVEGCCGSKR